MENRIEELSMNAWPAISTRLYDGWILRMSNGYTKRANSINPIYPSRLNLREKIAYCESVYAENGLAAVYKLTGSEECAVIDRTLATLGYEMVDETSVQVLPGLALPCGQDAGMRVERCFSEEWMEGLVECNKVKPEHAETLKTMLRNVPAPRIVVSSRERGRIVGCGYGAVEDGFAGVFDIVVREDMRGKGHGRRIVETILSEAGRLGAGKSYLQVTMGNTAAKALYAKLGYKELYRYWYRKKEL